MRAQLGKALSREKRQSDEKREEEEEGNGQLTLKGREIDIDEVVGANMENQTSSFRNPLNKWDWN